jgi:hypothetical protein
MEASVAGSGSVSISGAWACCVHLRREARYELYLLYWYERTNTGKLKSNEGLNAFGNSVMIRC